MSEANPTTQELLRRKDVLAFGPDKMVSSQSAWTDATWRLDVDEPGYGASGVAVGWSPGLFTSDGTRVPESIVEDCRRLVWIGLADASLTFTRKVSGAASIITGVTSLMRYLARAGKVGFSEWTPADTDHYIECLIEDFTNKELSSIAAGQDEDSSEPTKHGDQPATGPSVAASSLAGRVKIRISTLDYIWRARHQLRKAGVPVPERDPLSGRTASKVAGYLVDAIEDAIPPMPDEVFLTVVNGAQQVVEIHGPEVLEAQRLWFEETGGLGSYGARQRALRRLAGFKFDTAGQSTVSWPERLAEKASASSKGLSRLITALRDSCCLLILASTGIRLSELATIRSGWKHGAEFPDCIVVRRTDDKMLDLFFVVGSVIKHRDTECQEEWLIGCRAAGTAHVPAAVRAVMTLETLMAPWRNLAGNPRARERMCVSLNGQGLPRSADGILPLTRANFAYSARKLYRDFIDFEPLPDFSEGSGWDLRPFKEGRGKSIRIYQYRKNYSKFMMRIDSRLLLALKRQFKHMQVATTQTYYVNNNPGIPTGPADERRLSAGRTLAEILRPGEPLGGRLAKLISRHEQVMPQRRGHGNFAEVSAEELSVNGGVLLPGEHGWCAIRLAPHLSRCNAARGAANFLTLEPNLTERSATACLGCQVFLIDGSNAGFWRKRHAKAEATWTQAVTAAERLGDPAILDDYATAKAIAAQAAAVLRSLEKTEEPA
jgi:hypothetical protein